MMIVCYGPFTLPDSDSLKVFDSDNIIIHLTRMAGHRARHSKELLDHDQVTI